MSLVLYDTFSRSRKTFVPQDPGRVTLYVCGPTVYNYAHIGNARPAVVFDVLARLLRHLYGAAHVLYARNITDINDRITQIAQERGISVEEVAQTYTRIYQGDMAALGVQPPDIEPLATENVDAMIAMIAQLIDAGHAYLAQDHVLFDVESFDGYGRLSKRNRDEMEAGARVEVAPYKKGPFDFVLWKPSPRDIPGWESPWGRGRPGWHIECSAMIRKHLGESIDIHGGGIDLQFPHHENELAQSQCCHKGTPFVRHWMHNGFLNIEKEKMSKSVGNVVRVHELLAQAPGEAIRLALLNAHYRQPLDWSARGLQQARRQLDRLYGALRHLSAVEPATDTPAPQDFLEALYDDLNTPRALRALFALAKKANTTLEVEEQAICKAQLLQAGRLMGLLEQEAVHWFEKAAPGRDIDENRVEQLIAARQEARQGKNFAEADKIRDQLEAMGIRLEDGPEGVTWKRL